MPLELYELRILIFLLLHGPARKVDLVRALGLNWSTISSNLNRLMGEGLVVKVLTFSSRPTYMITGKGVEELESLFLELKKILKNKAERLIITCLCT